MKLNMKRQYLIFFLLLFSLGCEKEIPLETITISEEQFEFKKIGGGQVLSINTNADSWSIDIPQNASWISVDRAKGSSGNTFVNISVSKNPSSEIRLATINLTTKNGGSKSISIKQLGSTFESFNISPKAPDKEGMGSTATELAAKMKFGWNAGNTMEAIGGITAWGNPEITNELIKTVKANGFNAIRIPCSWDQYADKNTAKISESWLNKVKEVVQYCVQNDVYVVLNIHWDGGWMENNVTSEKQDDNIEKQTAYWEQIATHLRDFDEHLLFAGTNEPNVENAQQMKVLDAYHQAFVEAVRATGGKNAYRVLVIQGPSTDIDKTNNLMNTWPKDSEPNRLMAEVHFYTPWNFCGLEKDESWGNQFFFWGKNNHSVSNPSRNPTWGEEATVDQLFSLMKKKFIDKNIPVILGEFNAVRRLQLTDQDLALHIKSRNYYLEYVTKKCLENHFIPFYWDTGVFETGSGIFDRRTYEITDNEALKALTNG
jgi:endoglucanase